MQLYLLNNILNNHQVASYTKNYRKLIDAYPVEMNECCECGKFIQSGFNCGDCPKVEPATRLEGEAHSQY